MGLQSGGGASTRVGLLWEGGAAVSRLQLVRAALLKGLGFSGRAGLQLGRGLQSERVGLQWECSSNVM